MTIIARIPALFFFIGLFIPGILFSQKTTRIRLLQANEIRYDKQVKKDVQILSGDVILEHDSAFLYCDSAWLNERLNNVEAFGHIHIVIHDTLNLYGKYLKYEGDTKVAEIRDDVTLVDNSTTLTTQFLYYYRVSGMASYIEGGTILKDHNTLTSERGYYYTEQKIFYFRKDVELTSPDYHITCDSMIYNTETEVANFIGPTTIQTEDGYIYCENGWYDMQRDISHYKGHVYVVTDDQWLRSDSLFYDKNLEKGMAYSRVFLTDTIQDIVIRGNFLEYQQREKDGYAMMTDSALAVLADTKDSLFLHADTIWTCFDSARDARGLNAYYRVKFYRSDIQGMCDSLYYDFQDSVIQLYGKPVLWSEENQLTADSIRIWIRNKEISQMDLFQTCLIISLDDTNKYNQIRGLDMTGYFVKNKLDRIFVKSNAETIYYVREEDRSLIGINKITSGSMWIKLSDNTIERINYNNKPSATLFPEDEIAPQDLLLRNFVWLEKNRPLDQYDIFRW